MAYEIDFLGVGNGERSGDAIAFRLGNIGGPRNEQFVGVVDAGFTETGKAMASHITQWYGTDIVDLVVSTHPDDDHASGLAEVIENLNVGALWIHQPWNHTEDISKMFKDGRVTDMSVREAIRKSLDAAMSVEQLAKKRGVPITEPFTGTCAADVHVIGPTLDYYESLLPGFRSTPEPKVQSSIFQKMVEAAKNRAEDWNIETLSDECDTSAENNSSVVLAVKASDSEWWLLTGDAGEPALNGVLDYLDLQGFPVSNFKFLQIPHHGSHHNVGPTLLNRLLGPKLSEDKKTRTAFVSASKNATKHPSKKVTNAFRRRGAYPYRTNGYTIYHYFAAPNRGWQTIDPLPLYTETED